jgi:hypothetical protein
MSDLESAGPALRNDAYQSVRSFSMWPIGTRFRTDWMVSRADLATALVLGGRVPQYLPSRSNYSDVKDEGTALFVESAQSSPSGQLFIDAVPGSKFRPAENVTRLMAAVALVRAAGLRPEAESKTGAPLTFLDALSIPAELRGYVSVAVARGFLESDTLFRPQAGLTRGELAHALAVMQKRAIQ